MHWAAAEFAAGIPEVLFTTRQGSAFRLDIIQSKPVCIPQGSGSGSHVGDPGRGEPSEPRPPRDSSDPTQTSVRGGSEPAQKGDAALGPSLTPHSEGLTLPVRRGKAPTLSAPNRATGSSSPGRCRLPGAAGCPLPLRRQEPVPEPRLRCPPPPAAGAKSAALYFRLIGGSAGRS